MSWFRRIVGKAETPPPKLTKSQLDTLLKKLDEMNESPGLLHYVWNGQQVLGMAVFPPTEKRMEVEEFKYLTGLLFKRAREVMRELDIDISSHSSKHMNSFVGQQFDLIVAVCDNAQNVCP